MTDHLQHMNRRLTDEERRLAEEIREGAQRDFPPKAVVQKPIARGIPQRIHDARTRRGLTRYEVGKIADVPATVIRALEEGDDIPLSQFHAVVSALGLTIELVEQVR